MLERATVQTLENPLPVQIDHLSTGDHWGIFGTRYVVFGMLVWECITTGRSTKGTGRSTKGTTSIDPNRNLGNIFYMS